MRLLGAMLWTTFSLCHSFYLCVILCFSTCYCWFIWRLLWRHPQMMMDPTLSIQKPSSVCVSELCQTMHSRSEQWSFREKDVLVETTRRAPNSVMTKSIFNPSMSNWFNDRWRSRRPELRETVTRTVVYGKSQQRSAQSVHRAQSVHCAWAKSSEYQAHALRTGSKLNHTEQACSTCVSFRFFAE